MTDKLKHWIIADFVILLVALVFVALLGFHDSSRVVTAPSGYVNVSLSDTEQRPGTQLGKLSGQADNRNSQFIDYGRVVGSPGSVLIVNRHSITAGGAKSLSSKSMDFVSLFNSSLGMQIQDGYSAPLLNTPGHQTYLMLNPKQSFQLVLAQDMPLRVNSVSSRVGMVIEYLTGRSNLPSL